MCSKEIYVSFSVLEMYLKLNVFVLFAWYEYQRIYKLLTKPEIKSIKEILSNIIRLVKNVKVVSLSQD